MKNLILLIALVFVGQALASQTAKVIMARGKVTALKPGTKKAIIVKKNGPKMFKLRNLKE